MKILLQILIYLVTALISIAIITTSPILGGLIILAFTFLRLIPILIQKITEIINHVDKE